MLKVSECMETNGLPNFPDPDGEGGSGISKSTSLGIDTPGYAKAARKCGAPPGAASSEGWVRT